MSTNKIERETQNKMLKAARSQGFWASNTNDMFIGGKLDFRLAHLDHVAMDFELKILEPSERTIKHGHSMNTGLTALQEKEIREMNEVAAPALQIIILPEQGLLVPTLGRSCIPSELMHAEWRMGFDMRKPQNFQYRDLMRKSWQFLRANYEVYKHGN